MGMPQVGKKFSSGKGLLVFHSSDVTEEGMPGGRGNLRTEKKSSPLLASACWGPSREELRGKEEIWERAEGIQGR